MPYARLKAFCLAGYALLALATSAHAQETKTPFALHDGDRVVFYGDIITEQRLYTTFVEEYIVTRFPHLHIGYYCPSPKNLACRLVSHRYDSLIPNPRGSLRYRTSLSERMTAFVSNGSCRMQRDPWSPATLRIFSAGETECRAKSGSTFGEPQELLGVLGTIGRKAGLRILREESALLHFHHALRAVFKANLSGFWSEKALWSNLLQYINDDRLR